MESETNGIPRDYCYLLLTTGIVLLLLALLSLRIWETKATINIGIGILSMLLISIGTVALADNVIENYIDNKKSEKEASIEKSHQIEKEKVSSILLQHNIIP